MQNVIRSFGEKLNWTLMLMLRIFIVLCTLQQNGKVGSLNEPESSTVSTIEIVASHPRQCALAAPDFRLSPCMDL